MLNNVEKGLINKILKADPKLICTKNKKQYICHLCLNPEKHLTKGNLEEIFLSDESRSKFMKIISKMYNQEKFNYALKIEQKLLEYNSAKFVGRYDETLDYTYEKLVFEPPHGDYLNQVLDVNIEIDTGDGETNYKANCAIEKKGEKQLLIDNRASILWLAKQQGYKMQEVYDALRKQKYHESIFLEFLENEISNLVNNLETCTETERSNPRAQLCFFAKLTLGQSIELGERVISRSQLDSIIIKREANCGLFDSQGNGGGQLELKLEKDVKIPIRFISRVIPNLFVKPYNVSTLFPNMTSDFWKENVVIA